MSSQSKNRRILLVDDQESIHQDFNKILVVEDSEPKADMQNLRSAFFGESDVPPNEPIAASFETESAFQGKEALERVIAAKERGEPFAMAFVDIRMPPGWDGVQTIQELWKADPDLGVVICTAYSDYSWSQTVEALGQSDKLLILKKPFDSVEIRQLAHALVEKWNQEASARRLLEGIQEAEAQQRAYAASLETMNQALATSKAAADKAGELRGEFLERLSSQVNHNLAALIDRLVSSGQTNGLEDVLDGSRQLLNVLSEVMDYNQLESGTLVMRPEEGPLQPLLEATGERFSSQAKAKGLDLKLQIQPGLPASTYTDHERLSQVVNVLMDNAIRYTLQGEVTLDARLEHGSDWNDKTLCIDVQDTGPGIQSEAAGHIFEPLATNNSSGSGVGLALAKRLARALGGDLYLDSEVGKGSTFSLRLELSNKAA